MSPIYNSYTSLNKVRSNVLIAGSRAPSVGLKFPVAGSTDGSFTFSLEMEKEKKEHIL